MMGWSVAFAPLLPWYAIGMLAALGLGILSLMARGRARGIWLRGLTLALLVAAMSNPTVKNEAREALSDIAVAVIDRSLSQETGNRPAQTSAAEFALRSSIGRLDNTELRIVTVRSGIADDDNGTRAFASLDRALAEIPPDRFAGAVMVTDGQIHDAPENASKSGLRAPIHGLLTGSKSDRDRRVVIDASPRFGIVGKEQIVKFRIEETNGGNQPVEVTIAHGKGETQTMMAIPGQQIEFPVVIDHGGQNIVELSADVLDGEISLQNNRAIAVIEGVRDRLRVLLVSGEPHPGERAWRNLLKADTSVDLVHFTILRPPEKQDGTPIKELALIAFPTRELFVDKLEEFDLVIFDRYRRQAVLPTVYLANVARYVMEGGAVLIASGPDFAEEDGLYGTPLADIIDAAPTGEVIEGPFKPQLTKAGQKHPVTRGLPGSEGETPSWGRWFRLVDTRPANGDVVMEGNKGHQLLVLSRAGEGRVAQILSDQGWLWARGYEGGGPQTELLRRIAHWLMEEPDLEEEALAASQQGKNLVIERQTMADEAKPVTVTLPSGKDVSVPLAMMSPGRWQGILEVTEAGMHRLGDGTLQAVAAAGSPEARETSNLMATAGVLSPVAASTGGSTQWLEDGMPQVIKVPAGRSMAGSGWIGLKANGAYRVTAVTEVPLFATLLSLGILLLAACAMWYREGR